MNNSRKIFIVFAANCIGTLAAYSQDCNSYLQQATELVSQNKYCDALTYYQKYSKCNADADVSTEIAMCKRFCKIQVIEGEETETRVERARDNTPPPSTTTSSSTYKTSPSDNRTVKPVETVKIPGFNGFQLHGGLFFPQGNFASESKSKDPEDGHGHAAMGFNLGFKVYNPISSAKGLSWFFGADAFYNGLQSDYTEDLVEEYEDEDFKYRLPRYLNFPVTAGVNYAYEITNKFSIYGELAGGLNISKYIGLKLSNDDFSYTEKWKMGKGFTYSLGAGMLINNKITVGIRYNNLGAYKYKGKVIVEAGDDSEDEDIKFLKKLPVGGISLTVGILF